MSKRLFISIIMFMHLSNYAMQWPMVQDDKNFTTASRMQLCATLITMTYPEHQESRLYTFYKQIEKMDKHDLIKSLQDNLLIKTIDQAAQIDPEMNRLLHAIRSANQECEEFARANFIKGYENFVIDYLERESPLRFKKRDRPSKFSDDFVQNHNVPVASFPAFVAAYYLLVHTAEFKKT